MNKTEDDMDVRIKYNPVTRPDARIRALHLEMPGGTDAVLEHGGDIVSLLDDGRYNSVLTDVRLRDGARPSFADLSRAKVLDAWLEASQPGDGPCVIEDFEAYALDQSRNIQVPLARYSSRFPSLVPYHEIDRDARGMVHYFNGSGLPTAKCCSGHPGTAMKRFWIELRNDVTDADVARFMDAHTANGTGFTAHGMFCARYDKDKGKDIVKSIQYTAADILDAAMDLADWKIDDASDVPGHGGMDRPGWDRGRDAARIVVGNMDPGTADALYRAVWKDRLEQEIAAWVKNAGVALTPEQLDYAARRWAYDGKYDCELSHWENIASIVQLALESA